jgi:hypothetical protein
MSIKTMLLLTSLSMILITQNGMVQAAYPPYDIETAQSMKSMRPLLDLNQGVVPLSEFEPASPMKNFTLMTQEALNQQKIAGISTPSLIFAELQDDITNYQFARRTIFASPETGIAEEVRNFLKTESLEEKVAKEAQEIRGLQGVSFLSAELRDEISSYQFAKRVNFARPDTTEAEIERNSLKKESWLESIEKHLEKIAPYWDNYGWYDAFY